MAKAVAYLAAQSDLPPITNETGQQTDDPN
jgi:hypothetical protein